MMLRIYSNPKSLVKCFSSFFPSLASLASLAVRYISIIFYKSIRNAIDEELEALKQISGFDLRQEQKLVESKPEDLLKLSIQQTEQAIQIATSRLASMNEDYQKAHGETIKLHQEIIIALQTSTDSNDNALILEMLVSKTTTNKYMNLMKAQIEQQNSTIKILKSNLNSLKGFKSYFDSNIILKSNIGNSKICSNPPQCELQKSSDEELELLRKQLDEM